MQRVRVSRASQQPAFDGWSRNRRVPPQVEAVVRTTGSPLSRDVRTAMESRLRHDFSSVRVHTDAEAAQAASMVSSRAFTVGPHIVFGRGEYRPGTADGNRLLAHELTHALQQRDDVPREGLEVTAPTDDVELEAERVASSSGPVALQLARYDRHSAIARQDKPGGSKLLEAFRAKFPLSAKKLDGSTAGLKLVTEADAAGVTFGGYAEEGPNKNPWAYTVGKTVYVPKAHDTLRAMSDFLFELNNALREPAFKKTFAEARKGTKGTLDAKKYARNIVQLEVEGMLRLGEIWFEMKKAAPDDKTLAKYDGPFYLSDYQGFKDKKKTKEEIVDAVLKREYPEGKNKGKTVEKHYMEQFDELSGGK